MITPQDIREKQFEKAVFGGLDMAAVEAFMQDVATDLELLQKENATLKAKIKVLVKNVEEYRANEDAIRMAVVSAQRLGNIIESEAKEKAVKTIADAETKVNQLVAEAHFKVQQEEARLLEAQKSSVAFIEDMKLLCARQSAFLENVGKMDFIKEAYAAKVKAFVPDLNVEKKAAPAQPAPAVEADDESIEDVFASQDGDEVVEFHETVKSIEETVAKVAEEPVSNVRPDIQPAPAIDELPTRAFQLVTDPNEDLEQTAQFSFEGFAK